MHHGSAIPDGKDVGRAGSPHCAQVGGGVDVIVFHATPSYCKMVPPSPTAMMKVSPLDHMPRIAVVTLVVCVIHALSCPAVLDRRTMTPPSPAA